MNCEGESNDLEVGHVGLTSICLVDCHRFGLLRFSFRTSEEKRSLGQIPEIVQEPFHAQGWRKQTKWLI